jgi:putative ABC transport system permease protein
MFKNYFKTAWRNMVRNKTFSLLNIVGLALGLACSLLIFLWVNDEKNIDTFNTNKNIYGVYESLYSGGVPETGHWTPGLLAAELKRNVPEIKYASAFWNRADEMLFSVGDKNIAYKGSSADSDFFKIFSYPLLEGTTASALSSPDAIAISVTMANSFFGSSAAAIGKTVRCNTAENFKINAVFDIPKNASEKFDFVINWNYTLKSQGWLYEWTNRSPATFIELSPAADPKKVETKIKDFITPYLSGRDRGFHTELGLQQFDEMYLNSTFKNGVPDGGRIEYVRLFSLIAVFILLIACINFMNLATARSAKRAKEVGILKTIGALRWKLITQFIGESMLLTFFAIIIALVLVNIALPYFNTLTNKQIIFPFASLSFWLVILALLFITGFVAGSYPALFLASLNPVKVLKGALKFSPNAVLFRKGLVVFQFVLSIVMITGTIIISKQIHYVQTANLGYDKENLIYIPLQGNLANNFILFKNQLSGMPGIEAVTRTAEAPSQIYAYSVDLNWEGKSPAEKVLVIFNTVGYGFLQMMHIPIVQGHDFSSSYRTDGYIINESALKVIGYKNPIGKPLSIFGTSKPIIGVVKDFHLTSLHDPIKPLILLLNDTLSWGYALIKSQPGKTQQAIASMEKVFKQMEPKFPFRYNFVDEKYQKLYTSEVTVSKLSGGFAFFAIFISCLGLLGLTMFTAEQRRKEIGVRKVIGASVTDIVTMLSKDIVKLVLLAAIIATPIAWFAMNNWLQNFAYRTNISWWLFLIAVITALMIALITISFQSIKAAIANPVKSLRTE